MYYNGKKHFFINEYGKIIITTIAIILMSTSSVVLFFTNSNSLFASKHKNKNEVIVNKTNEINYITKINSDCSFKINDLENKYYLIGVENSNILYNYLKSNILNKNIKIEYDILKEDKFNNKYVYIYIDDILVNKEILKNGISKLKIEDKNTFHLSDLLKSQNEAKNSKLGIWSNI